MDILFLIYNLCLISLYVIPLAFSAFIYCKGRRDTLYLYIVFFFSSYILNNIVIYMTESISWFSTFYDNTFMSVPTVRTLIYIVTFFCMIKINERVLKHENCTKEMAGLSLLFVFLLFIPMMQNSAFKVWLYYGSCQLFTLILAIYSLSCIKRAPEGYYSEHVTENYRKILLWTVFFTILIEIEDTIVIFNFDVYKDNMVKIVNRSFSENIASIFFVVIILLYLVEQIHVKDTEFPVSESLDFSDVGDDDVIPAGFIPADNAVTDTTEVSAIADAYSKFYLFCRKYQLTTREQDIMQLLLENKNNTDISDELFISIGTAKTHIHNIFSKLDVKKRNQLIEKYNAFDDKEAS